MEIIMDILLKLLEASVFALLAYVAWKQRETSRNNEARRNHEKAELEARRAREKAEFEQKLRESERLAKERLEQVENQQIKIQSEADQQKAQLQIVSDMATGSFRAQEQWQMVVNTNSERRLEESRLRRESDALLANAINNQASAMMELKSAFEILVTVQGNVKTTVETSMQTIVSKTDDTHKDVSSMKDDLTLVQKSLGILTGRIDDLVSLDESNVESQTQRHHELKQDNAEHKTELVAINTALKTTNVVLEKILARMETTQPLPVTTVTPDP